MVEYNVVEFIPGGERGEVAEMRKALLTVTDEPHAMTRVAFLAERIADIINEIDEISVQDRQSLLWHTALIFELAQPRSDGKITPLCKLPRFDREPPGAA
jgi:hypothetical protein